MGIVTDWIEKQLIKEFEVDIFFLFSTFFDFSVFNLFEHLQLLTELERYLFLYDIFYEFVFPMNLVCSFQMNFQWQN